jgi:NAD(P)-dependent dehydrogenase (short-subunit alcohol dehydrogenase family)
VNDRDAGRARVVADEIVELGGQAYCAPGDMSRQKDVATLFGLIKKQQAKLDILVTQAGVFSTPDMLGCPVELDASAWLKMLNDDLTLAMARYLRLEDFNYALANNLHATFHCCDAAIPLMRKAGGGRIVTMTSAGGGISSHFSPPYGMAKGGVVGLTRALARQLLPENIIVNCVAQGFTDAGVWTHVAETYPRIWERDWQVVESESGRTVYAKPANRLPLRQLGRPQELAAFVAFLVSGDGSYFVGQNFNWSGGVLVP